MGVVLRVSNPLFRVSIPQGVFNILNILSFLVTSDPLTLNIPEASQKQSQKQGIRFAH